MLGSIDRSLSGSSVLADSDMDYRDYSYTGDLFSIMDGVFIRDLGSPGQYNDLTINGLGEHSIAFLADGVPLNDPMTGLFDLSLYPSEQIGRIEYIPGTRAFLYGLNATGGAINFVTKSRRAFHAYSRIHYSQSEYGFSTFDGMFTQNILRAMNISVGATHTTTGGRFLNSDYELWSARLKLRYDLNDYVDLFGSLMYNSTMNELNGGIIDSIPEAYQYSQFFGAIHDSALYEKITRYDLQLGGAFRFFPDSTLISTLTLYHSTNLREIRVEPSMLDPNSGYYSVDNRSQWFGLKYLQDLVIGRQRLDAGAEVERLGVIASPLTGQQLQTRSAVYGKTDISPIENIIAAGYFRFDQYFSHSRISYGADGTLADGATAELFGGFSHSYRFPTYQELYWTDSTITNTLNGVNPETHDLVEAGGRLHIDSAVTGELKYFRRSISDLIVLEPVASSTTKFAFTTMPSELLQGVSGNLTARFGKFYAEGEAQYCLITDSNEQLFPKISGIGSIYYWSDLYDGHLNLKAGFRGRAVANFVSPRFDPLVQQYLSSDVNDVGTIGVVDFVMVAKIGSAHIHFVWNNLFDRTYYITTLYPMPDRALRFGVSWEFED